MLLAAGRGERMRPLTDHTAKPLLRANGTSLIDFHLQKLAAAGLREVIINTCWQAEKLVRHIDDGARYGLSVTYSHEVQALETAGGVANALPLLGNAPFLLISGDVWSDVDFGSIGTVNHNDMAHLILVDNPPHHPHGDFALQLERVAMNGAHSLTYSGIGIFSPALFDVAAGQALPLRDVLIPAINAGLVSGRHHTGGWMDIGTPERLRQLDKRLTTG
jgi:MurNAc alpha-1-phosphate uridylyltransferase